MENRQNAAVTVKKINKSQFLKYVAERGKLPHDDLLIAYNAIVDSIADLTANGYELSLTGFGTFSVKVHKGHPVQFTSKSVNVNDYAVLKFSASDVLNKRLRKIHAEKVKR